MHVYVIQKGCEKFPYLCSNDLKTYLIRLLTTMHICTKLVKSRTLIMIKLAQLVMAKAQCLWDVAIYEDEFKYR